MQEFFRPSADNLAVHQRPKMSLRVPLINQAGFLNWTNPDPSLADGEPFKPGIHAITGHTVWIGTTRRGNLVRPDGQMVYNQQRSIGLPDHPLRLLIDCKLVTAEIWDRDAVAKSLEESRNITDALKIGKIGEEQFDFSTSRYGSTTFAANRRPNPTGVHHMNFSAVYIEQKGYGYASMSWGEMKGGDHRDDTDNIANFYFYSW